GARALVAFLVRPVPHLEPAAHNGHAALLKVLRYELSGGAPGDAVDEIGLLLFAAAKVAVHCDAEGRNGQLALCVSQLRVAGQAAHDDDVIEHAAPPYSGLLVMRLRMTPSVMPRIRSSSAGNSGPLVNLTST